MRTIRIVGLMSGTSADGIDAAVVEIRGRGRRQWMLRAFHCVPWPDSLRAEILNCCRADAPLQKVTALHFLLGEEFARAVGEAVAAAGLSLDEIDAIASHGQTVWHQPEPVSIAGRFVSGTLQIGEPAVLAARTGCLVISDFRAADMALGGQGAPLVPFADYLLFASPRETRAIQNLGGIANVTLLQAGGGKESVLAFDTGPGNMVLDALTQHLTGGAQRYDAEGALAARAQIHSGLLAELLEHPFFQQRPPRSTGREMFGAAYAAHVLERARHLGCSGNAILATATALTAETIARAYTDWLLPRGRIHTVILGGGGVRNRTLLSLLQQRLAPAQVSTHADFGLPDEAKEAVAFALLAGETLRRRPANLPSATGAAGLAILGRISYPPPPVRRAGDVR